MASTLTDLVTHLNLFILGLAFPAPGLPPLRNHFLLLGNSHCHCSTLFGWSDLLLGVLLTARRSWLRGERNPPSGCQSGNKNLVTIRRTLRSGQTK